MSDIDEVLRLGAKDVLLKPLNRLEEVKNYVCPTCIRHFSHRVLENNDLSGSGLSYNIMWMMFYVY